MAWPDWSVDFLTYSEGVPLELYHNFKGRNSKIVDYFTSPQVTQSIRVISLTLQYDNDADFLTKFPPPSL